MNRIELRLPLLLLISLLVALSACAPPPPPQALAEARKESPPTEAKIQNAMSAAPRSIAQAATILDWPTAAGGDLIELRKGTNGWTCLPDDPNTPTNDPMCLDPMWKVWLHAFMTGTIPHSTATGIAYMLQGGSDASNTDPAATQPPAGQDWLISPPHLMILSPQQLDPAVFSTDPHSGGPWIMWAGTPYEHLMVPVKDGSE
jgi:hypothetical protein